MALGRTDMAGVTAIDLRGRAMSIESMADSG
jgi:hypothetical protein